ncbi:MAG: MFS transporter, partial [Candidatus Dormibacteraeota bacterium]|nr:MFS transporter [Candidatus Dormibacteraeota bacterium]
ADRLGRRELLAGAALAGGVAQLGLGLSGSVAPLFAWQAVSGVASGASQSALYAAIGDVVPAARLGRAIGWLTLAFQFGFLIGPALAGLSLNFLSLQQVLVISGGPFVLTAVVAVLRVPGGRRSGGSWRLAGPIWDLIRRPGFAAATVGVFGSTVIWGTQQAYLPTFATEHLGLPAASIGYMIAIQAVANGLSRLPAGRLIDNSRRQGGVSDPGSPGRRPQGGIPPSREGLIVVGGLAAYSIALGVLPQTSGFWEPTLVLALAVGPTAATFISLGVTFQGFATTQARGLAMGLYNTVLFAGLGVGPVLFGSVIQKGGYVVGFTACAAAGLAFTLAIGLLRWLPQLAVRHRLQPADPFLEGGMGGEEPGQGLP